MGGYHFSASICSRASGSCAVAASAYMSGEARRCERYGETYRYARAERVESRGVALPAGAPPELGDAETLWNSVEAGERASNAQLARRVNASLPRGLTPAGREAMVRGFAESLAERGMCVEWSVHEDGTDHNPHAHLLMTMRPLKEGAAWDPSAPGAVWGPKSATLYLVRDAGGGTREATPAECRELGLEKVYRWRLGNERREMTESEAAADGRAWRKQSKNAVQRKAPTTDWGDVEALVSWREGWARAWNEASASAALAKGEPAPEPASHLSYEALGVDRVPTRHVGSGPARSGFAVRWNEWAAEANRRLEALRADVAAARAELARLARQVATAALRALSGSRRAALAVATGQSVPAVSADLAAAPAPEAADERPPRVRELMERAAAGEALAPSELREIAGWSIAREARRAEGQAQAPKTWRPQHG